MNSGSPCHPPFETTSRFPNCPVVLYPTALRSLKLASDITLSLATKTSKPVGKAGKKRDFSLALHRLAASLLDFTRLHHVSKGRSLYQHKGASTP